MSEGNSSCEISWVESDTIASIINTDRSRESATDTETEANASNFCNCALQLDETEKAVGPTPSDILYDTLIHHDAYDESEDELRSSVSNSTVSTDEHKLNPFSPKWCIGFNPEVTVINLSTKFKQQIFFAASHKGILYDYGLNTMVYIHGHVNRIVAAAVDSSGKWLATSDVGEGSIINITDTFEKFTVHTINNEDDDKGATLLGLSPGGKYLISIHGAETAVIKFWLWTYGLEDPSDTYVCDEKKIIGEPKKISFHPDEPEYIMIAFQRQIFFFKWDEYNRKFVLPAIPITTRKSYGLVNDCTLAARCHECFAVTSGGYILIFGSATYSENFEDHAVDNEKSFIKCIKAADKSLIWLSEIDDYLVTLTSTGIIKFYDKLVRLIFWIPSPTHSTVAHISFNTEPRIFKFKDPFDFNNEFFTLSNPCLYIDSTAEERAEEEILYENTVPTMCNLDSTPFVIRSYISTLNDGSVHLCDIVHKTNERLLFPIDSHVASIDCSNETNHLVIAYCNGRITLFDIDKLELITTSTTLMERKHDQTGSSIQNTYVKYGPQAINLALGTSNGEIWFLNPVLEILPEKLHKRSSKAIELICFSQDEKLCAYSDAARVVHIMKYTNHNWQIITKMRSHCKSINDIMFANTNPQQLYTIGSDGYLVEYNIVESTDVESVIKSRILIDQCALRSFLYYPHSTSDSDRYILTANDDQKYRMINVSNFMCKSVALGPAHGCYKNNAVKQIEHLPGTDGKYIVFMNKNHIGIQKLPVDGNPYKYVGIIGNPNLKQFVVTGNGQYVFTCGVKDQSVFMWEVNPRSVDILHRLGGVDVEPYFCLIEGGANGWYFHEMQDLFCYMQILHQGDSYRPQSISDSLAITELPDLLRSCGYYPSNFEIENILNDIKYRDYETTGKLREDITFVEFVKLYINHKPANGINLEDLALKLKCLDASGEVPREIFAKFLCKYGEPFTTTTYDKTMQTLVRKLSLGSESDQEHSYLPKTIDFENLTKEILGILQETVYEETQEKLRRERHSMSSN